MRGILPIKFSVCFRLLGYKKKKESEEKTKTRKKWGVFGFAQKSGERRAWLRKIQATDSISINGKDLAHFSFSRGALFCQGALLPF
jgi:hypothetical protein